MFGPLTTHEFNQLLHMAVDTYKLDPKKTYIEFTWWDKVYRPAISTDCNTTKSHFILVFGSELCNTFYDCDGIVIPTAFYTCKDVAYPENVVHYAMSASAMLDSSWMLSFDFAKFLFANSPINYYVDVNPFKTRVMINRSGDAVIALYAEDRDGGEWRPFNEMEPSRIKLIDDATSKGIHL